MVNEQMKNICQGDVQAVMIWRYGDKFLGCLMDNRMNQIPGSTIWNAVSTVEEVLEKLEGMSIRLQQMKETE